MSLEPSNSPRLATLAQLAAADRATTAYHPYSSPTRMTVLPSSPLAAAVAVCAGCHEQVTARGATSLCPEHEAVWRFEQAVGASAAPLAGDVGALLREVLSTGERGSDLLAAFRRQAAALNMVWEAHLRGAARLPEEVADLVRGAREGAPDFLAGRPTARTA